MDKASSTLDKVLSRIDADLDQSLERLFAWLRIPSISTDPAYAQDCRRAAEWLKGELAGLGVEARLSETGGHPVVLGHAKAGGSRPHVLFYGHYDVQPVDPLELWETPPFEPRIATLPDGRKVITARGACDDKGQVLTFVEACRAWKAVTGELPVGLTVLIEGAEENGSEVPARMGGGEQGRVARRRRPRLRHGHVGPEYATHHQRASRHGLRGSDRPLRRPRSAFGLVRRRGAEPIRMLSRIIADLHDADGRVTIPGFYEGVTETPKQVLEQWKKLDLRPEDFLGQVGLGIPAGEKDRMLIEQIQSRPTCDANGIIGGYTGVGAKTVIASQASAKISFRLVGDQDPQKISEAFKRFVRERIPADCSVEFVEHKNSTAIQLPYDMPALTAAKIALADEWGREPVTIGSGGSIPIVGDFKRTLGLDTVLVGFGLDDDRVHSPNEKYDLKSFHKGARSWARILAGLAN